MKLPTRGEHVYETYWLPLQDSLSNDELEQLMWLQLVLDGDDRVRRQDLYAAQQQRFERRGAASRTAIEGEIEGYIRELYRRGALFRRILHPEEEPDDSVRAPLHRLHTWQAQGTYPALMLLLDRRERGDLDSADTARAMSYIESFLVRRMMCRVPTNNLNRIFQAVPGQLPFDMPVADGLHQLLSAENRFRPDDDELREKIHKAPFYQYGRWHQRKMVLQRLEESYGHQPPLRAQTGSAPGQSPGDEPPHRRHRPLGREGDPRPGRRTRRSRHRAVARPAARSRTCGAEPGLATGPPGAGHAAPRHLDVLR